MKFTYGASSYRMALVVALLVLLHGIAFSTGSAEEAEGDTEPVELVILSHQVHQNVMTGGEGAGKNLLEEFLATHPNVESISFITAGTSDVRDRLFREAALAKTDIDVGFAYSPWLSAEIPLFFNSIEPYADAKPLDAPNDIFQGFWDEVTIQGERYGVPMRAGGQGILFYNKRILEERGVEPPSTIEELVEAVKATTFTRSDGEKVYGFASQGNKAELATSVGVWFRAMDGDFFSANGEPAFTDERLIEVLGHFKDMYQAGAFPPTYFSLSNADRVSLFQNGRAAFTTAAASYLNRLSLPGIVEVSDIGYMNFPPAAREAERWDGEPPASIFQWAMLIPRGSENKDAAWDFIRFMSSRDAVLNTSLSGNGPVRQSTFDNPIYAETLPYIEVQAANFRMGRPMFLAFENFAQVRDIMGEAMAEAILGNLPIDEAMRRAEQQAGPLM